MIIDISEKVLELMDEVPDKTKKKNKDGEYPTKEQGTGIKFKVKPLSVIDYQKLISAIRVVSGDDDGKTDSESGLDRLSNVVVANTMIELLPIYCSDLEGVDVMDDIGKRKARIDDVVKYGHFYSIGFRILVELMKYSTATEEDKKK